MQFEHQGVERIGQIVGYVCSYCLFTTILYLVLRFFDKIPPSWSVLHVAIMTLFIVAIAEGLRKVLQ